MNAERTEPRFPSERERAVRAALLGLVLGIALALLGRRRT
jgi:hypothetical protein